jgi:hypothetical protein
VFADNKIDPYYWKIQLFCEPTEQLYIIMICCAAILFILGIIILAKHLEERK